MLVRTLFALSLSYSVTKAERILLVAMQQRSHINEMVSLGEQLISRGHDVFIILYEGYPDEQSIKAKGLQTLTFKGKSQKPMVEVFREIEDFIVETVFDGSFDEKVPIIIDSINDNFKSMHTDESMWRELKYLNFDFAMVDGFYLSQAPFLVPYRLGVPYGYTSSTGAVAWLLRTPNLPSFVQAPLSGTEGFGRQMSFKERVQNLIVYALFSSKDPDSNTHLLKTYAPEITSWSNLALKS